MDALSTPLGRVLAEPARDSPATSLRTRRRTSLPSKPAALSVDTSARPRKRSPNYIRSQTASPEVISSLIDQLSAISASTQSHFESLPSADRTAHRTPAAGAGHDAGAADLGPYSSAIRRQNDLYPDDACEPPVVRTSKPPSGLSPMTAPAASRRDKPHALAAYAGRSGGSAASLHSCHSRHSHQSHRSSTSFGAISVEAAPAPARPVASNRSSLESKRSVKRPRSLLYMGSRERLRQRDADARKRLDDASPASPRVPAQLFEDTIREEPHPGLDRALDRSHERSHDRDRDRDFDLDLDLDTHLDPHPNPHPSAPLAESSRFAHRHSTSPARRLRMNLVDGPPGESIEQGLVPDRASSLRHGSPTKKSRKSSASRRDKGADAAMTSPAQPPAPALDPEAERKQRLLLELEQEESEVAQRIKQLREQKLLRDQLAGKLPAVAPVVAKPHVSSLPRPEDAPATVVSSTSEERGADVTKAHKLLGISPSSIQRSSTESSLNKPLPNLEPREPTRPAPLPPHLRHSRHRSLTVNDGDDLSLPINYALALQSLENSAPNSPRTPRVDSTHMTLPPPPSFSTASTHSAQSSSDGVKRSSSLSMAARPPFGRKSHSMGLGVPKHKHSSSLTEGQATDFRPASEEINSGRHSSLSMASASNSFTLQQKKTLKKKRWSHPDLPAKAEKEHNDKADRQAAEEEARKSHHHMNPWSPVIEERSSSRDSIDMEVDAYLHAPRLSQKIRHPQTGRVISFSEVGDPTGFAIFVCVGMGLTRFVMAFYDQLAATLKLRLITPERPGIGSSQVDPHGTPLTWPDDILIICQALKITKFSLLAHSAGAIYALATSLRMPQHIRGRVHLLAPWIPPSQMAPIGMGRDSPPTQQLPRSQRFLRALPPSLLRVANSTFLSNTSASLQRTVPAKAPKSRKPNPRTETPPPRPSLKESRRESMLMMDQVLPSASTLTLTASHTDPASETANLEHRRAFDERLTFAIWDRATLNANPATDLIVCLETKQPIGFRYEDINRPVVIHHGSKDSRVPVDNVRWLGRIMRKCEVRVLEGEQHGLMASAGVMGKVLMEMAEEWESWTSVVRQASAGDLRAARRKASFV